MQWDTPHTDNASLELWPWPYVRMRACPGPPVKINYSHLQISQKSWPLMDCSQTPTRQREHKHTTILSRTRCVCMHKNIFVGACQLWLIVIHTYGLVLSVNSLTRTHIKLIYVPNKLCIIIMYTYMCTVCVLLLSVNCTCTFDFQCI